jgi:hypothetical protein
LSRVRQSGKVSNPGQSQLPEGIRLLLWISTGEGLWRSPKGGQPKERRRKAGQSELSRRGGHGVSAGPVKTFRNAGDGKNATAGLWIKGNLRARGETRGTGQTRRQKRRLTRCSAVKTRTESRRRVFTWFASRWRNHQPKRAEKPHSKSSDRKALDGPATRPQTPLAVENSVGKLAANLAPHREAASFPTLFSTASGVIGLVAGPSSALRPLDY